VFVCVCVCVCKREKDRVSERVSEKERERVREKVGHGLPQTRSQFRLFSDFTTWLEIQSLFRCW
jgi:hypothetical protein